MSHRILLRGLGATTRGGAPLIVQRTDDDFLDHVIDECRDPALAALLATRASDTGGGAPGTGSVLRLFLPTHRTFHLALFEAVCDRPGEPRLDPDSIDSAGLVIRRVASARNSGAFGEAWRSDGARVRRWQPFTGADALEHDPDPARRPLPDQGHPEVNARLRSAIRGTELPEEVVTLFPLPADVCAAAGRTILFGLIPTASADIETRPETTGPGAGAYSADEITEQVPPFLRAGKPPAIDAIAGDRFTAEQAEQLAREAARADARTMAKQMLGFLATVKTLAIQLDAFGTSPDAAELRRRFAEITLTFADAPHVRTADAYLAEAADVLVMSPGTGRTIAMPQVWPVIETRTAGMIHRAFGKILQARFAAFAPRTTRFDDPTARYRVRGFVRVRRDDGCPPALWWSEPSAPYRIAAWYESGAAPPVVIRLPKLDRASIKQLKPNAAFVVPGGLFNLLGRNSPKDFLDGAASPAPDGGGLAWICGFNIPVITLCAFIILYIFLTLLNIIFFWLPFVRVCFPLPRGAKELVP